MNFQPYRQPIVKKMISAALSFALAVPCAYLPVVPTTAASTASDASSAAEAASMPATPGTVNLLDTSRFNPQSGVNLKVSSETADHPGADALRTDGSGYWRNSSPNVYNRDYSPSSLAFSLDLGAPQTIDKLYLEIPNTIANIQNNATRYEVYYANDPQAWTTAPTASDSAIRYDWQVNGWKLAGGTETEGLWSYVNHNGQQWAYDTKTFLYPFTARYVMINTVLVGPSDRRADDAASQMGLSGVRIYGKAPVVNATKLTPDRMTYSTWDQVLPVSTQMHLAIGQSLTSISQGDTVLQPNVDFHLTDGTITFALPYLAKLPLGTIAFTLHFNDGTLSICTVDVTARGYGVHEKTIKMNAIAGVSPYNVLGGAMGTDEPVEGVTKRIRDAYHSYYGDQPTATAADDHIKSVWDSNLQKNVFQITANGRGLNNEFLDKVRDGEYGHKGVFDWNLGYVVDGAAVNDRQRIEIRPSEDSTHDFVAYEGDQVAYEWMWNIPDGTQWNQSNFRHIFQLKAVNRQLADTLPGGNNGGENGAYLLAMSISGTNSRDLVVNHNRFDGDKTMLRVPLKEIDGHWIKVQLNALISDSGWFTVKITDTVTGKVYSFDNPDVFQAFANKGGTDGVKDLWRRPERAGSFETEFPAAFDQYLRPKWGIYRSSAGGTNSAYDSQLKIADITISKVASGVSSVNLALNKKAYNAGSTAGANPIQLQSVSANEFGNANKLTNGVLEDPTLWNVTNVTNLAQIGNYSWPGTDGERKGSFILDLGQAMDFSQIRLFAKSSRLKGASVYISDDVADHASAVVLNEMTFQQVEKKGPQGYTFYTGNEAGGFDAEDRSYPIDLGQTYHARYVKVMVENASGSNAGMDLTGPPRLTQVQVFNAPPPPQQLRVKTDSSGTNTLQWDAPSTANQGYMLYNGASVFADLPAGSTRYTLPASVSDLTQIAVRAKGTDPYSHKFMISAPALLTDSPDTEPPVTVAHVAPAPQNGWLNTQATVTLAVYDNDSGVVSTEYRIGDNRVWLTYTSPIVIKNDGLNKLQFRSTDRAGVVEPTQELIVPIDQTKPSFVLTVNGSVITDDVVYSDDVPLALHLSAEDALSGIQSQDLSLDGEHVDNDSNVVTAGLLGPHTLNVTVTDKAGNGTEQTFHYTVKTSIDALSNLIQRYAAEGQLQKPLTNQLANSLSQAQHQLSKGDADMAAKHMQDFLKHLNNSSGTDVMAQAKFALVTDANALINGWTSKP